MWKICVGLSELRLSRRRIFNLPSRGMRSLFGATCRLNLLFFCHEYSGNNLNQNGGTCLTKLQCFTCQRIIILKCMQILRSWPFSLLSLLSVGTFCWLQGALWYFLPGLLCESICCFSLLVADLHNVCCYCKCLFKSNHFCSFLREQYFYFLSFSTFLSPYFPLVLSSLPTWCNFSSISSELFLPRQWCSRLFLFDRNVLSQTEQYGTKL